MESGRGRGPADRCEKYAMAFHMAPRDYALTMLRFNVPHTYRMIFGSASQSHLSSDVDRQEERLHLVEAKLFE